MQPFVSKIANMSFTDLPPNDGAHPWGFLRDWTSPINDGNLEELSQRGKDDSFEFGRYMRKSYAHLFPPKWYGKGKDDKEHKKVHHKKGKKGGDKKHKGEKEKHKIPYKVCLRLPSFHVPLRFLVARRHSPADNPSICLHRSGLPPPTETS
jgi:hypothetical protein